jgi:H3 lysine-79-specific histone-lysine N-methyltransferase
LSKDKQDQDLLDDFKDAVHVYNEELERLITGGVLAMNLDNRHDLPHDMVHLILGQVYDRAVSPQVDLLKAYENGTDNVYGELLHPFVSRILKETKLKSDQVFVDLGSGVGNVVLQAALEVGCESWGCEMMENATKLAERQEKEFEARCRLWGVQPGKVRLEKGDFLENGPIKEAIKSADVILVNNQAFTSDLNRKLVDLFLDVKDGCQIVSLQPFGKLDKDITPRNIEDPACSLRPDNKERTFSARDVSWTDGGGWYHIATKDRQRQQRKIEEFGSQ